MKLYCFRRITQVSLIVGLLSAAAPAMAGKVCCTDPLSSRATDGCSNPFDDPASKEGKKVFRKACDFHDMCYAFLGKKKSACDSKFRDKMNDACDKLPLTDPFKYGCNAAALVWYGVVAGKGGDAYKAGQKWAKNHCYVAKTKRCKKGYQKADYDMK
jgi:hypothetical protein